MVNEIDEICMYVTDAGRRNITFFFQPGKNNEKRINRIAATIVSN